VSVIQEQPVNVLQEQPTKDQEVVKGILKKPEIAKKEVRIIPKIDFNKVKAPKPLGESRFREKKRKS
jgi:hypothetical protein